MTRDDSTAAPSSPESTASKSIASESTASGSAPESTAPEPSDSGRPGNARRFGGRRFVLTLYALLVAFAGVAGVLFSRVVDSPEPPALFFLFELPPSALGFAVFGAVTIAVVLGVPLALVVFVSERVDDPAAR